MSFDQNYNPEISVSNNVRIEGHIRISANGPYFTRILIQGCRLVLFHPTSQESTNIDSTHFDYWILGSSQVPSGTLLTCWAEQGEFAGRWFADYWIVQVNSALPNNIVVSQGIPVVKGSVEILAHSTNSRATRLKNWWNEWATLNGGQTAPVARWLGAQIKRGYKNPHPFVPSGSTDEAGLPFNPIDAWTFEKLETYHWF